MLKIDFKLSDRHCVYKARIILNEIQVAHTRNSVQSGEDAIAFCEHIELQKRRVK